MDPKIRYEALLAELREIYKFESKEKFTLKWIDEEGMSTGNFKSLSYLSKVYMLLLW